MQRFLKIRNRFYMEMTNSYKNHSKLADQKNMKIMCGRQLGSHPSCDTTPLRGGGGVFNYEDDFLKILHKMVNIIFPPFNKVCNCACACIEDMFFKDILSGLVQKLFSPHNNQIWGGGGGNLYYCGLSLLVNTVQATKNQAYRFLP